MFKKELTQDLEENRIGLSVALQVARKAGVVSCLLPQNFLNTKSSKMGNKKILKIKWDICSLIKVFKLNIELN